MREKLTKKDVEKIEQEIEHRKLVVRKEAIEAVKEARAQGDLSENFEYYAAKRHKNQNESRIRYLENMLKTATIVSDKSSSDEVGMDDIVEVYFEEDDEIEKYKLVTSIRGNSMENRISIDSPIGMALKGHKIGDRVEVKVNDNYSSCFLWDFLNVKFGKHSKINYQTKILHFQQPGFTFFLYKKIQDCKVFYIYLTFFSPETLHSPLILVL